MKNKKAIAMAILLIALTIIISIMSFIYLNNDITKEEFISKMESQNLVISDKTIQYEDDEIVSATTASNESYQLELLIFKNKNACEDSFQRIKNDFSSTKQDSDLEINTKNEYSLTTSSNYMYVKRTGKTLIYFFVDSSYKANLEKIIEELNL